MTTGVTKVELVVFSLLLVTYLVASFGCGTRKLNDPDRGQRFYPVWPWFTWVNRESYPGQWPWYGLIYHRKLSGRVEYACGGTLISEKHFLASRLCVVDAAGSVLNRHAFLIRVGTHNQHFLHFGYAQYRKVAFVHQPVDFDAASENQIAILELSINVKFNDYVQPMCIVNRWSDRFTAFKVVSWEGNQINGKLKTDSCRTNCETFDYIVPFVCDQDRGASVYTFVDGAWHILAIVNCSEPLFASDRINTTSNRKQSELIYLNAYMPWIIKVTNLKYLQKQRKGRNYDPSKQYPYLLPRRHCGFVLNNRTIGHQKASRLEYPWMALLGYMNWKEFTTHDKIMFSCIGSIISHRYVLTTARCTFILVPYVVRLGEYNFNPYSECFENVQMDCDTLLYRDYMVEYVVIHQDYRHSLTVISPTDVALIRLTKDVKYKDHIQPICLPLAAEMKQLKPSQFNMAGWSISKQGVKISKPTVALAESHELCQFTFNDKGPYNIETSDFICIKEQGVTSQQCEGDRGAPLGHVMDYKGMRFVQYGIAMGFCAKELSVHTDVANLVDWIIANMHE